MLALYNVSNFVSYDCLLPPNKEVTVSFEEMFAMLQTAYVAGMRELKVFSDCCCLLRRKECPLYCSETLAIVLCFPKWWPPSGSTVSINLLFSSLSSSEVVHLINQPSFSST